ncbi:MAG: outer membrane beta-barrel protein [Saprospiraceae bacterium]
MKKIILFISFLILSFSNIYSQCTKWEIFGGIGFSNIMVYDNDIQALYIYPPGAPNFLLTFHGGVNYNIIENKYCKVSTGLGFFTRGSSDFVLEYNETEGIIVPHRIGYIRLPINFNYRLLKEKNYYFFIGITPAYLIWNNFPQYVHNFESGKDPVFEYAIPFQFEYELGFLFPILKYNHFFGKCSYSKGITTLDEKSGSVIGPNLQPTVLSKYNISFDLSLFYKF